MNGFVLLHRKIVDWEWYTDINTKCLFIHLILLANHKDEKWRGETVKRGTCVTSLGNLSAQTGLTFQQVRTSLKKLERTGDITIKATNKNTVIMLVKYDFYQSEMQTIVERNNKQITSQSTINQQSNNKQVTTNNNDNNVNNENNIKEKEINKEKEITMLTKTSDYIVTPKELDHWKELYPKVKVEEEMKSMVAWLESNPTRRKEKRYMKRFINSWLNKANKETKSEDVPSWYADTKQTEADESLKKEIARIQKELREET